MRTSNSKPQRQTHINQVIDTRDNYLLYRAVQTEIRRDKILEAYNRTGNPKTKEILDEITRECDDYWQSVRLSSFIKS
jgi:propanediol dehydratase small subunit